MSGENATPEIPSIVRAVGEAEDVWRQIRAGDFIAWQQFADLCKGASQDDKHSRIVLELLIRAAALTSCRGEA